MRALPAVADAAEDRVAPARWSSTSVGVARGDAHVGLGEHHLQIVERGAEERPGLDHLAQQRLVAERRAAPAPTPYQPGSITRACAQLNTQGMARRSSIRSDLVRLAGREPILRSAISAIGVIWRKKVRKPSVS